MESMNRQAARTLKEIEAVSKLLSDKKFIATVARLTSKGADERQLARKDVRGYFATKGVKLAPGLEPSFRAPSKGPITFMLCSGYSGGCRVCLRYTGGRGWWFDSQCR